LAHRVIGAITFFGAIGHTVATHRGGAITAAGVGCGIGVGSTVIALLGKTRVDHTIAAARQHTAATTGIWRGIGVGRTVITVFHSAINDTVTTDIVATVVLAGVGIDSVAVVTSLDSEVDHGVTANIVATVVLARVSIATVAVITLFATIGNRVPAARTAAIGAASVWGGIRVGCAVIALLTELRLYGPIAAVGQHTSGQTVDTVNRLALLAKLVVKLAVTTEGLSTVFATGILGGIRVARAVVTLLTGIDIYDTIATEQEATVAAAGERSRGLALFAELGSVVDNSVTAAWELTA